MASSSKDITTSPLIAFWRPYKDDLIVFRSLFILSISCPTKTPSEFISPVLVILKVSSCALLKSSSIGILPSMSFAIRLTISSGVCFTFPPATLGWIEITVSSNSLIYKFRNSFRSFYYRTVFCWKVMFAFGCIPYT
jgi:hypothetical protein